MSTMKALITTTYKGELPEGEQKATITGFAFHITSGIKFRSAHDFPIIRKALPADFDCSGMSLTIPLENIMDLFNTSYEPTTSDYYALDLVMADGRTFRRNLFERDLAIFLKQTRVQILADNTVDLEPIQWIKDLIGKEISIWITYPVVPTRDKTLKRVQNVNYCKPLASEITEVATDSTEPEPF